MKVRQASANVSSSASYGTITASGISGASVNSSGVVTVSGMTADTGYVSIPISYAGQSTSIRVDYTKARDGNAATSATTAITTLNSSAGYLTSANFNISLAAGASFTVSANASYFGSASYTPRVKLAYQNSTDGGAETDFTAEVDGDTALASEPGAVLIVGSFTNSTGSTKVFNVRLLTKRAVAGGTATSVSGTFGGST